MGEKFTLEAHHDVLVLRQKMHLNGHLLSKNFSPALKNHPTQTFFLFEL